MGVAHLKSGRELRQDAESKLGSKTIDEPQPSPEEVGKIVHELRVHQIELDAQNEELRESHSQLQESHDKYSELFHAAPVGYLILDGFGIIHKVNSAGATLLDKSIRYLVSSSLKNLVNANQVDTLVSHLGLVFSTGDPQACEIRLASAQRRHIRMHSAMLPGREEMPICLAAIWDITDQKNAEEALRKSEERFRAIAENSPDLIFVLDDTLKFTHVNPAVEKLLDTPASKMIGRTYADLVGPEKSERDKELDLRVLNGDVIEDEYGLHINGMDMVFLDTRMPVMSSDGKITGVLCIARDITDRRRWESKQKAEVDYPSNAMQKTLRMARMAAGTQSTILLLGESGSGKDHLAKFIHSHSNRSAGPYYAVNCAAISKELAESELFGHEKGAFTGAHGRKRGLLELAEGGTILLNEIGELPLTLQAKLLTFLDTRKFNRVGGEKEISVNARLIAATNRNLAEEVESGSFRKDLYYRLNVVSIVVPPLRERREDIPLLVQEFLVRIHIDLQLTTAPKIDPPAMNKLINYGWPGNVRELRNVLERSLMLSSDDKIHLHGLESMPEEQTDPAWRFITEFPEGRNLNDITKNLKRAVITEALRRSNGSRQGAAKLMGISRYSLKHYMRSLDLGQEDEDEASD
jgi:two-component system, NtrC family, response regulator AtoC